MYEIVKKYDIISTMKGLLIKQPWIDYILSGNKIWEIRSTNTNIRGKIELIQSGSGLVVGSCEIVDSKELTIKSYRQYKDFHKIKNVNTLPYKRTFAWIIKNAQRYETPRKYKHHNGAIIWVNLD